MIFSYLYYLSRHFQPCNLYVFCKLYTPMHRIKTTNCKGTKRAVCSAASRTRRHARAWRRKGRSVWCIIRVMGVGRRALNNAAGAGHETAHQCKTHNSLRPRANKCAARYSLRGPSDARSLCDECTPEIMHATSERGGYIYSHAGRGGSVFECITKRCVRKLLSVGFARAARKSWPRRKLWLHFQSDPCVSTWECFFIRPPRTRTNICISWQLFYSVMQSCSRVEHFRDEKESPK